VRKLINDPADFADEVIDGILLAHGDRLRAVSDDRRALVRADAPGNRVGIVTGGGSGHLPLFLGYVGRGLCSGVAIGNVFSSPSAEQVLAATTASDSGRGVLFLFGNYGGDVMSFGLAADLAELAGTTTRTVLVHDDVLSAPADRADTRRGTAGLILAYKCAGAAAERGDSLEEVARLAALAAASVRTVGVGLSPTILPAAGQPTFELPDGEMEIGRGPLQTAGEVARRMITVILDDLEIKPAERVAVLVDGLGATPLEEQYLLYRGVRSVLDERGIVVHRSYIGEFVTSLEMAGASITVMRLDDELTPLIDAPASSPFFRQ
jgi:phosphoenolpyruvate---glycerone phosphotransferase subunit DhaK